MNERERERRESQVHFGHGTCQTKYENRKKLNSSAHIQCARRKNKVCANKQNENKTKPNKNTVIHIGIKAIHTTQPNTAPHTYRSARHLEILYQTCLLTD